jgi:adenylyltransferase/sulfurtransferase
MAPIDTARTAMSERAVTGHGVPPIRATIIGAGGLGGPIAMCLGAAGIELTIVDHDVVEASNLHRQVHFTVDDIGSEKAPLLAKAVMAGGSAMGRGGTIDPNTVGAMGRGGTIDPNTVGAMGRGGAIGPNAVGAKARGVVARWRPEDADDHTSDADLVIDASDDPQTKFAVSDWAVANGRRYVIASALRYGGNVMAGAPGYACYRCLFEEPAVAEEAPSCADAGVLGPVVGAIGGIAAAVALGLAHEDRTYAGALLVFDDLRAIAEPRIVRFAARATCPACARAPISPFTDRAPVRIAEGNT